jgi:predicted RNase H-like HicB family nuclease
MPRIVHHVEAIAETKPRKYSFTVVFEPLTKAKVVRKRGRALRSAQNPSWPGYQVTVPLLPGLVTYGRTLKEAREMARDAITCYLEGLLKDGRPIPGERVAIHEKLNVALTA